MKSLGKSGKADYTEFLLDIVIEKFILLDPLLRRKFREIKFFDVNQFHEIFSTSSTYKLQECYFSIRNIPRNLSSETDCYCFEFENRIALKVLIFCLS